MLFDSKQHIKVKYTGEDTLALKNGKTYALVATENIKNLASFEFNSLAPDAEIIVHNMNISDNIVHKLKAEVMRHFTCSKKDLEQLTLLNNG